MRAERREGEPHRPARGRERAVATGSRRAGPAIEPPEDADPRELAYEVRSQLRTLSKLNAEKVAKHLVAAGRLVDEDPAAALQHARAARALGARVAVVREAVGETAYAAGEWTEAIAELRTARRMTGDDSALPMIADAERALGRADRALKIAQSDEAQALEPAERAEMRIVEAGARHDLGQLDAALLTLQDFGLDRTAVQPWSARVWYAYADLLLAAGREDEAREWFVAAAGADRDGSPDAEDRLLQLDGIEVLTDEDDEDDAQPEEDTPADVDVNGVTAEDEDEMSDAVGDEVADVSGDAGTGAAEAGDIHGDVFADELDVEGGDTVDADEAELTEAEKTGEVSTEDAEPPADTPAPAAGETDSAEQVDPPIEADSTTPAAEEGQAHQAGPAGQAGPADQGVAEPVSAPEQVGPTGNPIALTFSDQSESGSSE